MEFQIVMRLAWQNAPVMDFSFGTIRDGQFCMLPFDHLKKHASALTKHPRFDALLGTQAFIPFKDVLTYVKLCSAQKSFVCDEFYGNMIVITLNLPDYVEKEEVKEKR